MFRLAFLLFFIVMSKTYGTTPIKPFTSDGCSIFPDGTLSQKNIWLECCTQHDKAYWVGGSYQERLEADNNLKTCVEQVNQPSIAQLMLVGVRVGGTPYIPTKFRWGYGWPYMRGYKTVTASEKETIQNSIMR